MLFSRPLIENIPEKPRLPLDKWKLCRSLAKKHLSANAQLKLEWIIFYHTLGKKNVSLTAAHFGISRKTLHKWLKRFDEGHPATLEEHTSKPTQRRRWLVTENEEEAIKTLRLANIELRKKKLAVLYKKFFGKPISCWKI